MKTLLVTILITLVATVAATVAAAGPDQLQTTPIGRLPFPERGFVIDLPDGVTAARGAFRVTENGRRVENVDVAALGTAGISYGTVLAIDTSLSMKGAPLMAALAAGRSFVAHRAAGQQIGVVAFDGRVRVLRRPGPDDGQLARLFSGAPGVAFGTRIYDALERSLALLDRARLSSGSIVLLSDGADLGSRSELDSVIAKARARHVRVFTVGLRSKAFAPSVLQKLAAESGGSFAEASSADELASIYNALGQRLAGEYVVRYRSTAPPKSDVDVKVEIHGVGVATTSYTAPTPSGLAPFHRSLLSRFLLSGFAVALLALFVAGLAAFALLVVLRSRESKVVDRVQQFAGNTPEAAASDEDSWHRVAMRRARVEGQGGLARIERQLEIARIDMSATRVVLLTLGATVLAMFLLGLIAPIFMILALLTPLGTKGLIERKLRQVRGEFGRASCRERVFITV